MRTLISARWPLPQKGDVTVFRHANAERIHGITLIQMHTLPCDWPHEGVIFLFFFFWKTSPIFIKVKMLHAASWAYTKSGKYYFAICLCSRSSVYFKYDHGSYNSPTIIIMVFFQITNGTRIYGPGAECRTHFTIHMHATLFWTSWSWTIHL